LIRFHGLGNETPSDSGTSFYRVFQNLYRNEPRWVLNAGRGTNVSLGIAAQYSSTRDDATTLVGETRPYGSDDFGQVAARVGVSVDRRDSQIFPTKGVHIVAGGSVMPPLWSVERTFGEAHATAATYVSARGTLAPTLALRAGGQHVFGTFPFHEAAFLGGASTLRGWDQQRFAGRSAVYGSAELRMRLGKIRIIVPADIGVMGFSDVGRVFLDDEESDRWHTGNGGGLWIAPLMRNYTLSVSVAQGRERTGVYLRSGFAF
jgi:outer membrane protein assembly factor BamA